MRFGWFAVALASAGCESMVDVKLTVVVPDEVAALYDADSPGIVESSDGENLAAVCGGDGFTAVVHTEDFGCEPDNRDVTVEAWIVPIPSTWDPAFCDDAGDDQPLTLDEALYPSADLSDPTDADPQGSVDATWDSTPICGGNLVAKVVLAAR